MSAYLPPVEISGKRSHGMIRAQNLGSMVRISHEWLIAWPWFVFAAAEILVWACTASTNAAREPLSNYLLQCFRMALGLTSQINRTRQHRHRKKLLRIMTISVWASICHCEISTLGMWTANVKYSARGGRNGYSLWWEGWYFSYLLLLLSCILSSTVLAIFVSSLWYFLGEDANIDEQSNHEIKKQVK